MFSPLRLCWAYTLRYISAGASSVDVCPQVPTMLDIICRFRLANEHVFTVKPEDTDVHSDYFTHLDTYIVCLNGK